MNDSSNNKQPGQQEERSANGEPFSRLAKRFLWVESASAVERVIFGLAVLCVLLFVLDFIVHRHAYAPGEGVPGFYAFVGFVAFTFIVLGAAQLRRLILRNENYYAPFSVESEHYPEAGLETLQHGESADRSLDSASDSVGLADSSGKNGDRT